MTDLERVKKVVDWLIFNKIVKSRRELAEKMNYTESSMSQILNGKVQLSDKFIKNLSIMHKDINLAWLLTGEGEMLKSDVSNPQPYLKDNLVRVPYVSASAYASFVDSLYGIDSELYYFEVVPIDGFNLLDGSWLVFDVKGDSMSPTIQEGSKILCQRIDEGKWETASGVVVIVYGKTLTVKRILHNDIFLNNRLVLKADNELHGQVDIPLESIRGIWQAVRVVDSVIK